LLKSDRVHSTYCILLLNCKKSLKISKGKSQARNRRKTKNTKAKRG